MEFLFSTKSSATSFAESYVSDEENLTFKVSRCGKHFRVDFFEDDGYQVNQSVGSCLEATYL